MRDGFCYPKSNNNREESRLSCEGNGFFPQLTLRRCAVHSLCMLGYCLFTLTFTRFYLLLSPPSIETSRKVNPFFEERHLPSHTRKVNEESKRLRMCLCVYMSQDAARSRTKSPHEKSQDTMYTVGPSSFLGHSIHSPLCLYLSLNRSFGFYNFSLFTLDF